MAADGIAKPEDFRRCAEQLGELVRVVLPGSHLAVLLRPPNALRALLISNELGRIGDPMQAGPQDQRRFATLLLEAVRSVLVQPRLSLTPGPEEIDPNWLPEEDAKFLINWGLGIPSRQGGTDAQEFSQRPGPGSGTRERGGDVALPPERDPRAGGSGGAAS